MVSEFESESESESTTKSYEIAGHTQRYQLSGRTMSKWMWISTLFEFEFMMQPNWQTQIPHFGSSSGYLNNPVTH